MVERIWAYVDGRPIRGLGVAGRRLGKVLLGVERQELEHLALAERGHHGLLLLLGHRLGFFP